jgi:hypothetical protein
MRAVTGIQYAIKAKSRHFLPVPFERGVDREAFFKKETHGRHAIKRG